MKAFASVRQVNSLRYRDVRSAINDGDVLMYLGRNLPSRLIQWATRSRYSHAGLAAWWNGRLMVLETVGKGVVVTPSPRLQWNL